jgi:hypothetical protein
MQSQTLDNYAILMPDAEEHHFWVKVGKKTCDQQLCREATATLSNRTKIAVGGAPDKSNYVRERKNSIDIRGGLNHSSRLGIHSGPPRRCRSLFGGAGTLRKDRLDDLLGPHNLQVPGSSAHQGDVQLRGALRVKMSLNAVVDKRNQSCCNNNAVES